MASEWCFDIPIDHRLKRFLVRPRIDSSADVGAHRMLYEDHGRSLQRSQSRSFPVSDPEIDFGSWLARPDARGGLVVALMQPARSQRYSGSFEQIKRECATLNYLDDALQGIGLVGLEDVTCIDALPFYLESPKVKTAPPEMRAAYEVFLEMVRRKKPDVILGAWQGPEALGDVQYSSKGVGAVDDTRTVVVDGHPIKIVNAFHPSYAINYNPNESCFRQLFLLEMTKAFAELDGNWKEEPWMQSLRANCGGRASTLARGRYSSSSTFLNPR